jgi:Tfp pilus assembly protein PilN
MTAALAIWAAIQRIGASALSFLGKLNIWQLLLIAALLVAGVQTVRLKSEQRTNAKLQTQVSKLNERLTSISTARDTQKAITRTNIVTVTKTIHDAEGKAKQVETAPLPGNCKTPKEVLNADI